MMNTVRISESPSLLSFSIATGILGRIYNRLTNRNLMFRFTIMFFTSLFNLILFVSLIEILYSRTVRSPPYDIESISVHRYCAPVALRPGNGVSLEIAPLRSYLERNVQLSCYWRTEYLSLQVLPHAVRSHTFLEVIDSVHMKRRARDSCRRQDNIKYQKA